MLNISFNKIGCIMAIIIFVIVVFLLKFWFLLIFGFIFYKLYGYISKIINKNTAEKKEFVSTPGKIYKECVYCGVKAERNADVCDSCGRFFE
jgi:hypothetical protein